MKILGLLRFNVLNARTGKTWDSLSRSVRFFCPPCWKTETEAGLFVRIKEKMVHLVVSQATSRAPIDHGMTNCGLQYVGLSFFEIEFRWHGRVM